MLVAQAQTLAALFEKHGVEVPQAARDALLTAATAAEGLSRRGGDDLRAAILAGEVNPKNVVELVDRAALVGAMRPGYAEIIRETDITFGNLAMQALRGDPGPVIAALRPRWLETAAVVVDGARYFTVDTYANNPGQTLAKRPEAAAVYSALGPALASLDDMGQLVFQVCRLDVIRVPAVAFYIAEAPADGLPAVSGTHWWLSLYGSAGCVPAVNTPEQARAIVATAQANVAALSRGPKSAAQQMRDASNTAIAEAWEATLAQ